MRVRHIELRHIAVGACALALSGLAVLAIAPGTPRADVLDPTVAKTIAVGDGGAIASCDRGNAARNGRVGSLPVLSKSRWQRTLGIRIEYPPVVAADGRVIVIGSSGTASDTLMFELAAADGKPVFTQPAKVDGAAASGPVLLANGLRVIVAMSGDAFGIDAGSVTRFRTQLGAEPGSASRVSVVPLSNGGFAVARRGDLIEVDGSGAIVGRTKLDVPAASAIAVRKNGDVVAVSASGDLYPWRAGRLPHLVGSFSDKASASAASTVFGALPVAVVNPCPFGPVIDGDPSPPAGGRRERAICVSDSLVQAIDLGNGTRKALLAKAFVPFRTQVAIGLGGELVVVAAGGGAVGVGSNGTEFGPIDVPGTLTITPTKDAGVTFFSTSSMGELPPLVGSDGSIMFGSSEGIAIAHSGALPQKVGKCNGAQSGSVAGVQPAGPSSLVIACHDGKVELVTDAVAGPITKPSVPSGPTDAQN